MNSDPNHSARTGNRLLDGLPAQELLRVQTELQPIDLPFKHVLYQPGDSIDYVYFLNAGVASAVAVMEEGKAVEVANIGLEGMVGVPALIGPCVSANRVVMQVGGAGYRMRSLLLERERTNKSQFHARLVRYSVAWNAQISRTVGCNALHAVKERCCRWILMTQDRVQSDVVPLTHEFLATMLGVRRASVSEVLQPLQAQGMLSSERGEMTILNRRALEDAACDCYRAVVDVYRKQLGEN